ncbi:hypothetical protein EVG20_g9859 [Dentipellis fragilis]|uniref:Uncharacterized protein n=1 Tax=Dentipellis fragilis TaxID=205917 RepID=A0A4Y9XWB3_9AGAM|nr:hypothetical protein EVG20_g9859 [Dentipellis fragilis]
MRLGRRGPTGFCAQLECQMRLHRDKISFHCPDFGIRFGLQGRAACEGRYDGGLGGARRSSPVSLRCTAYDAWWYGGPWYQVRSLSLARASSTFQHDSGHMHGHQQHKPEAPESRSPATRLVPPRSLWLSPPSTIYASCINDDAYVNHALALSPVPPCPYPIQPRPAAATPIRPSRTKTQTQAQALG